jgi:hypothetical protein
MATQSANLGLYYISQGDEQGQYLYNESILRLDTMANSGVISRTTVNEPSSPSIGDAYILPAGATGARWDDFSAGNIVVWIGTDWREFDPIEGLRVWVNDEDQMIYRDITGFTHVKKIIPTGAKSPAIWIQGDFESTPQNGPWGILLENTQAATDEKRWSIQVDPDGTLKFYSTSDDGSSMGSALRLPRTGSQNDKVEVSKLRVFFDLGLKAVSQPATPPNGESYIWQSNGTGTGDDGDIMITITDSGGTTKTVTLVDFSAS